MVGLGDGESFIASAIPAFLSETRNVQLVHDGEIVAVTPPRASRFIDRRREPRSSARSTEVDWDDEQAEKGGYETFMLKEIHEQADAVAETIAGRARRATASSSGTSARSTTSSCSDMRRVVIVACGTSYHAGLVGPLRDRGVGARARWRWTSPPSSATATRCSTSTTSSSASPSPARPRTRSPRCAWRASAARRCSRSRTSRAARPRATPTACCSRARASRSAWPPPRRSSRRWRRCTCSR